MKEFHLTLLSNSSVTLYDNTLSSFTNLLNSTIELDDNWLVGLSEIYVNRLNYKERNKRDTACQYLEGYTKELTKIKKLMEDYLQSPDLFKNDGKPKKNKADIPNLFDYIDSIFHPIQNLTEKIVEQTNDFKEIYSNHNDIIDLAFVYTDIIQTRLVGSQLSRVLKVIPLKNNQDLITIKNIEYYPVQSNILKDISILITNGSGQKIDFKKSSIPTFCTLHFKKRDI